MEKYIMKIYLRKVAIMAIFIFSLSTHESFGSEDMVETVNLHLKEMTFIVSLQDLTFDQAGISVNWEGNNYLISSLEREGGYWVARTNYNSRYCPEGHNLCKRCGLCHLNKCRYYVPPCWK